MDKALVTGEAVLDMIRAGDLTAGHARALVTSDDPVGLAQEIVKRGLSVRETEKLVKAPSRRAATNDNGAPSKDADTRTLEKDLAAALGLSVSINHDGEAGRGKVTLSYKSLEQLDEICRRLSVTTGAGEV